MEGVGISQATPALMGEMILEYSIAGILMLSAAFLGSYVQIVMDAFQKYFANMNFPVLIVSLIVLIAAILVF